MSFRLSAFLQAVTLVPETLAWPQEIQNSCLDLPIKETQPTNDKSKLSGGSLRTHQG